MSGAVSPTAPKTPFYGHAYVGPGSTGIIGPTTSTIALTGLIDWGDASLGHADFDQDALHVTGRGGRPSLRRLREHLAS